MCFLNTTNKELWTTHQVGEADCVSRCVRTIQNCAFKHSFMQRPIHSSSGWVKPVLDGQNYGWKGSGRVKSSKIIDIFNYGLEISVNGVTCVNKQHTSMCSSITVNIHVSIKQCVTPRNVIMHKLDATSLSVLDFSKAPNLESA